MTKKNKPQNNRELQLLSPEMSNVGKKGRG